MQSPNVSVLDFLPPLAEGASESVSINVDTRSVAFMLMFSSAALQVQAEQAFEDLIRRTATGEINLTEQAIFLRMQSFKEPIEHLTALSDKIAQAAGVDSCDDLFDEDEFEKAFNEFDKVAGEEHSSPEDDLYDHPVFGRMLE